MTPAPTRAAAAAAPQRGFTIIESLVALAVVAFGLLGIVNMQSLISRSADVAKQRAEATRLAQQKIEELRAYTTIEAVAGQRAWNDLAAGNDVVSAATNASFARGWTLAGAATDTMRRTSVNVAWTDRTGETQMLTLNSVISKTNPLDIGVLGVPLPQNTTLKRPLNRNLNIPVPARDLGQGRSVYQFNDHFAIVFSNDSGYVILRCPFVVTSSEQIAGDACTQIDAYIVAGYISMNGTTTFPAALGVDLTNVTGPAAKECPVMGTAVDQNDDGETLTSYKYYLCLLTMPAGTSAWSGTIRLRGMNSGTNYVVCRFQYPLQAGVSANARNVQPYAGVNESLDNQNYVITTGSSCPTISSLATVQHQNCRSSNPNSNPSRATDCPA